MRLSFEAVLRRETKRGRCPPRAGAGRVPKAPCQTPGDYEAGVTWTTDAGIVSVPVLDPEQATVTVTLLPIGPEREHVKAPFVAATWISAGGPATAAGGLFTSSSTGLN